MKISYRVAKWPIVIIALSGFLLGSCSYPHLYHSPNMMTVPLFTEGGEFSAVMAGSFGTVNPSFEMQTAFSIPGHVALGVNYMTGGKDNSGDNYEDISKNNYFEGFGGFYTSFSKTGVFEIYAGYGEGKGEHTFAYNDWDWGDDWAQDGEAEMKFSRIFIQPDVGIRTKSIEAAFSMRLSRIDFKEIVLPDPSSTRFNELHLLQSHPDSWLIEPGITFRGGHEPLKFQIQAIFSLNPSNPDLSFERFRFNIGLNLKFGMKKKPPASEVLQN